MRFRRTIGGYIALVEQIDGDQAIGRVYRSGGKWIARTQGANPIQRSGKTRQQAAHHLASALLEKGS